MEIIQSTAYGLISVLYIFSNVMESLINSQMIKYLQSPAMT